MTDIHSIADRLQHHTQLTKDDRRLLAGLESNMQEFPAGSLLDQTDADGRPVFYSLKKGWACAIHGLAGGQRQILDIYLPGEIMGLHDLNRDRATAGIRALTSICACIFSEAALFQVFESSPALSKLFFIELLHRHTLLTERIVDIGRRPAIERIAHFLLEMKIRLRAPENDFAFPLTQALLADVLSMSPVHVSRMFAKLKERGLVEMTESRVVIGNLAGLIELAGFEPDYLASVNFERAGRAAPVPLRPVDVDR